MTRGSRLSRASSSDEGRFRGFTLSTPNGESTDGLTPAESTLTAGGAPPPSRPARREVVVQRAGLGLELADARLDHVADAHDAIEAPVVDYGHVADAPVGHDPHELVDRRTRPAGRHLVRHELGHLALQDRRVSDRLLGERTHDVALRTAAGGAGLVVPHAQPPHVLPPKHPT